MTRTRVLAGASWTCVLAAGLTFPACESPTANVTEPPPKQKAVKERADSAGAHAWPLRRAVEGRRYDIFARGGLQLELRLEPVGVPTAAQSPARPGELRLCVAGTYTSSSDEVEGLVMLDGQLRQPGNKSWEGLLVIAAASVEIRKVTPPVPKAVIDGLQARRASVLQGHLLVHQGHPSRFKGSRDLQRRAVALHRQLGVVIIESVGALSLAQFAEDLAFLGFEQAMNLDMGQWDEGWYRRAGDPRPTVIGNDRRSTHRQSNWLVFVEPRS